MSASWGKADIGFMSTRLRQTASARSLRLRRLDNLTYLNI
jgi:hypothetical protein